MTAWIWKVIVALGVPTSGLQAVSPTVDRPASCAVEWCDPADQACAQRAFDAVLGCLRAGRVDALPGCPSCVAPGAGVTVFRAHGGGKILYGTFGRGRPRHEPLLRGIAKAVERPVVRRPE